MLELMELLILLIVAALVRIPLIESFGNLSLYIKLIPLTIFLCFIAVNFTLFKQVANRRVATFASLFLIFVPIEILSLSLNIVWLLQAATLLFLAKYFDGPAKFFESGLFLVLGLLIGISCVITKTYLYYLIPALIYFLARFRQPQDESLFLWLYNFCRLKYFRLPKLMRFGFMGLNILLLAALLIFPNKTLNAVLIVFSLEIILLYFIHSQPFSKLIMIRNLGPLAAGLIIGYLPATYFHIFGAGAIRAPHPLVALSSGLLMFFGITALAAIITGIYFRKDLKAFIQPKPGMKPSYVWIYYLIAIASIAGNVLFSLKTSSVISPVYLAGAVILGYLFGEVLWKKSLKIVSILTALVILSYYAYNTYLLYHFSLHTL